MVPVAGLSLNVLEDLDVVEEVQVEFEVVAVPFV